MNLKKNRPITENLKTESSKRFQADLFVFIITLISFVGSGIYISYNSSVLLNKFHDINLEYYSLVVALIPVLLIAIYFSTDYGKLIDSKLSAWSEIFGRLIPAIASIGVSLYAVATHTSNGVIFFITIYGLVILVGLLSVGVVMPGFTSKR